MKNKLLCILLLLCSMQVNANHLQHYNKDNGANEYKENTSNLKLYNSWVLGTTIKFLSGGAEEAGNKLYIDNRLYSPLIGLGLGVAFDKENFVFQQIRLVGELTISHNNGYSVSKINGGILEEGEVIDTSTSLMLNSYWNFNDITNAISIYFSVGMGSWARRMRASATDNVSAFAGKFGLGITKKINEVYAVDVGIYNLTTTQFNFGTFVMRENETGLNLILRTMF